jgi:ABC-type sugar transport system ATPase subunit
VPSGLQFRNVTRSFGAVRALRGVTFDVAEGEVHGLIGENGAGKSTLLKILAGITQPDAGDVHWRGERLHLRSPREALERGIGMVYQEMLCFENLSVAGNIFAGREITRRGRLCHAEMRERTSALLAELHLPVSPDAPAESLSTAYRQILQVARALAFECRILVLDEPTTSLTDAETDHLFAVLEKLKARGTTLLYVSHRLPEVFRLCDRITVLRDGAYVETCSRRDVTPDHIVRSMVGRDLPPREERGAAGGARTVALSIDGLGRRPHFTNVSLAVNAGEVVALFGLVGSGRSELLETVFGLYRPEAGRIRVCGQEVRLPSPRDAVRAGICLVPEERQRQGLLFNLSVRDNLVLPERTARGGALVRPAEERRAAMSLVETWRIKTAGVDVAPDALSGGNQQKIVVAKWLATTPSVILLDEPTKGVDVGAKFEIHEIIRREAARGAGCLVASSDLPEVLALADRVVVMREGQIQGQLAAADATEESVMRLATHEGTAA